MIKAYLSVLLILLGISTLFGFRSDRNTSEGCRIFTIYLVRHAEKDLSNNNGGDPPLTACGQQRSVHLSAFLSDVPIQAIYSTDYTRTKNTARPTAKSKELEIQEYGTEDLEAFSKLLMEKKQDALVVGHSNTTAELAGLLIGEQLADIDLDIYDRLYQVVIHKKNGRLHLLHTSFHCNDQDSYN